MTWKILGHTKEIRALRKMISTGRVPHALLFSGPEGIGKLRIARNLAAALLCSGEGERPCGICPSCQELSAGVHPDYFELHPEASGKSAKILRIDAIRELQTKMARLPLRSQCRVAILNDAEKMNEAAANSLLKTLEEPTQSYFLLVTGSRSALLDTILSRCTPIAFAPLPTEELESELSARALPHAKELAALADGSLGRALRLAEGNALALREDAANLLLALPKEDPLRLFARGKRLGEYPREDLQAWLSYLSMLIRDLLLLQQDGSASLYHADLKEKLLDQLQNFPESKLLSYFELLRETQKRSLANVNLRLLMEAFLLRAAKIAKSSEPSSDSI